MLKEMIREDAAAVPVKEPKWRNLIFDASGKSYRGRQLYNTAAEAMAQIQRWEISHKKDTTNTVYYSATLDGKLYNRDYAWAMPMPVWEE